MKKFQIIIMLCFVLVASTAMAGVNYTHFTLDAFDRGIKVLFEGKPQTVGTTPIIINNQVMISLRDAAKIFNKDIAWDGVNNTVNIGANAYQSKPKTHTAIYKYIEEMTVIRNVGPFYQPKRAIAAAGQTFAHGIVVDLDSSKEQQKVLISSNPVVYVTKAEVKILLNKNYTAMDGRIAVEDESMNSKAGFKMRVYGDDVLLYQSELIQPAELAKILSKNTFGSLSNVNILKIELEQQAMQVPGETSITKAALPNFKFYKKY